jgi:MFS family permease
LNTFTSPKNGAAMFIIYSLVLRIGSAAVAISSTNLLLELTPVEHQPTALSVMTIITGVLSFLATLAVSPFIDFMQGRGNELFGMHVYAQQILSALCALFYLLLILYYNLVFLNEKRKRNEK